MIKKIIELSKVFIQDYFQNLYIFQEDNKKLNKKSVFTWLLIITILIIAYLSYEIIKWLSARGMAVLFLKVYLPIIATVFMFQAILICSNVFYFSKDLEYILPLPIKPIELLIAKFINVISITYCMELIFLVMPLFIYGVLIVKSLLYFPVMILVLVMFPIFLITIVSLVMLIVMQLSKFVKNKDIFQIIIVFIVAFVMIFGEFYLVQTIFEGIALELQVDEENREEQAKLNIEKINNKFDNLNNYFLIINPCINMLTNLNILNILWQLLKLIFISIITFAIFIIFGKILYLKNLLKNIAYINKKKNKRKKIKNKYKKYSKRKSYIKNEFRKIFKEPTFFLQCIFQYLSIIIVLLFLVNIFTPIIIEGMKEDNQIEEIGFDNVVLQTMCIVIGILQIIFTFSNLSITAISREGKNAIFMKTLPVPLYKQFVWKAMPQIFLNTVAIIGLAFILYINLPQTSIWYYIAGIIIGMILNLINSFLMLIVDLRKPNLDWATETSAIKDNGKKLYQYVFSFAFIWILSSMSDVLYNVNIKISLISIIIVMIIIFIIIRTVIKKTINKLFNKII